MQPAIDADALAYIRWMLDCVFAEPEIYCVCVSGFSWYEDGHTIGCTVQMAETILDMLGEAC
ncbi:MAG: hypothetical protein QOI63_984 [Thermoplasmata archaeon]|jgi:hypothetical protein|nr:hypothetical protein [Thermoplasmata archaeon]